jgi:hypothetical protein
MKDQCGDGRIREPALSEAEGSCGPGLSGRYAEAATNPA